MRISKLTCRTVCPHSAEKRASFTRTSTADKAREKLQQGRLVSMAPSHTIADGHILKLGEPWPQAEGLEPCKGRTNPKVQLCARVNCCGLPECETCGLFSTHVPFPPGARHAAYFAHMSLFRMDVMGLQATRQYLSFIRANVRHAVSMSRCVTAENFARYT